MDYFIRPRPEFNSTKAAMKQYAPKPRIAIWNISIFLILIGFLSVSCKHSEEELPLDRTKPDENRFTPVVLTSGTLDEPMNFEVLKNGRVYIAERKGGLEMYDPASKTVKLIATIPVNTKYTSADGRVTEAEEGFVGFTIDPKFEKNHWAYFYYAHPTEKKFVLSRWELIDDKLTAGSEKIMLEISTQRETCCHTGGGMTWDDKGNLFLTVGNNTGNVAEKSQTDERPGRSSWDDQRGSGNTNDLRGKILRIHLEPDGTYSIPEGNLFPKGTPKTRPEIFVMGDRNPWRPSLDSKTGFLYWGEVGPDANEDTKTTKMGYDELNQARKPGNFGWPYFIGENRGYPYYDYVHDTVLAENNPDRPRNNSVNNTGLNELPPAQPAFISYPYRMSEKFPQTGSGARCAVGGPVYRYSDFRKVTRPFPGYFDGKWIAADLSRGWVMSISMKENGDYDSMERFMPSYQPVEPIDLKFGPTGDLYVLEYGSNWFRKSDNSRLVRIEFNSGNRTPFVRASADKSGGIVPLKVNLSSAGTLDYDGDSLRYEWKVNSPKPGGPRVFNDPNPSLTLDSVGIYTATLTVSDPKGAKNSSSVNIIVGNEPPVVSMNIGGNKCFFFPGKPIKYSVNVTDAEDGSLADGRIKSSQVAMSIDYTSEGFDYAEAIQKQRSVDASTRFAVAKAMMVSADCKTCHNPDSKSIGPMFTEIAERYKTDPLAPETLANKIRNGGVGVWGEVNMPAHPAISMNDARTIVNYILHVKDKNISTIPSKGSYTPKVPEGDNGKGNLIIRAAYTDRGANTVPSLSSESVIILRSSQLKAGNADTLKGVDRKLQTMFAVSINIIPRANGFIGFKNIDMTGIKQLELIARASPMQGNIGGTIEIRLDAPEGELIGQVEVKSVNPVFPGAPPTANSVQNAGGIVKPSADKPGKAPSNPSAQKPSSGAGPGASAKASRKGGISANFNPFASIGLKTAIKEKSGIHNIYFVFKNDKAKGIEPLMSFSGIKFIDE